MPPRFQDPLYQELDAIDTRLLQIREERAGIAGPIVLTAVGGGVAFICAYAAVLTWIVNETERDDSHYGSSYGYSQYEPDYDRTPQRALIGAAAVGLGASLAGIGWLTSRLKERQLFKPEVNALKRRRRELMRHASYSFSAAGQGYGLSVSSRF